MSDPLDHGLASVSRIRIESTQAHEAAMGAALRAGQLMRGPHLVLLTQRLTEAFGKRYAVLAANGFAALFLALRARRLEPGTAVRTAAAGTCFAMVNAIRAADLTPEFADLEADSLSLEMSCEGTAVAIAPDHFGRLAASVRGYQPSAGSFLVEDAAQAFFSRTQARTDADAVVLSFYPTKWLNGIDGGAVLTDDPGLHDEMQRLVSYADQLKHESKPRYNLAMPNLHAAHALVSFEQRVGLASSLRAAHATMACAAGECGLKPLAYRDDEVPTRFLLVAHTPEHRDHLLAGLVEQGIEASRELLLLCPPEDAARYPEAERLVERTLSLPFHPYLRGHEIERVVRALQRCALA